MVIKHVLVTGHSFEARRDMSTLRPVAFWQPKITDSLLTSQDSAESTSGILSSSFSLASWLYPTFQGSLRHYGVHADAVLKLDRHFEYRHGSFSQALANGIVSPGMISERDPLAAPRQKKS